MKSWIRSLMTAGTLVAALTLALPAHAEGEKQDVKEGKPKKRQFTGTVTAVDAAAKTFTLKNKKGEEKSFACAETCKVSLADREVASLADVNVGDRLTSTFMAEGDKNLCHKLVTPKSKKKEKEKDDKAE